MAQHQYSKRYTAIDEFWKQLIVANFCFFFSSDGINKANGNELFEFANKIFADPILRNKTNVAQYSKE